MISEPTNQETAGGGAPAASLTGVNSGVGDILSRGGRILLLSSAIMLAWAMLAPLSQAVISNGQLVSEGFNKVLQHRSGGVVRAIHAKSGESVEAGELILELDPDIDQAELTRLRARMARLEALRARLEAERLRGLVRAPVCVFRFQTLRPVARMQSM